MTVSSDAELIAELRWRRLVLKTGEYDGADLMRAWCAMADAADRLEALTTARTTRDDGLREAAEIAEAETGIYPHGNQMFGSAVGPKIATAIRSRIGTKPSLEGGGDK